jgi:DNA-directed RNA polymerase specialized sigma24 family protein
LRLQAGLSADDTAVVLGCSIGTVKSNLHDARRRLTKDLTGQGYGPMVEQEEVR